MGFASLQSSFYGSATVTDVGPLGGFQTFSGGEVTAADTVKDRPPTGNDIDQPVPGPRTIGNVTMSRSWDEDRDGPLLAKLIGQVNRGTAIIARHPLDADGNPKGTDRVYGGILIRATGPEADRNSNEKATLELEFSLGSVH